ncbi:response regulator [Myxococcota bacterium]|nr:response regulator [Myxococcota bacterium]MBU1381289.1 response regulator [Myxococcota bacterium]MBU1495372.1 response regulator [Myxococcota bacterium]
MSRLGAKMGFKVLIAEDDRHTRTILEHIFTKDPAFKDMEIELLLASDGEQALRYFKSHSPDLIISDLLMPKIDGFAFCRAVRESPGGKDIPLVITSAIYKETALLNRLREELGVVFFAKPFQVREFTNEILSMINLDAKPIAKVDFKNRITMSGPFKGKLEHKPLPSLLLDIHDIDATGVLVIEKGKMKKEIFFQFGRPVGAESNIRHETLGHYLLSKNLITEDQHQQILVAAKDGRFSFLRALIESGTFDEETILKYHNSLVKVRIVNAFRWNDGEYSFLPGDDFSERITKSPVDVVALVFAGIKRIIDLDEITSSLHEDLLSTIDITERGDKLASEFIRIYDDTVISKVKSGNSTLGELLGTGLEPMEVYSHIYALNKTSMISLTRDSRAEPSSTKIPIEDPYGLSSLRKAAVKSEEVAEEISIVVTMPVGSGDHDEGLILDIPIEVEDSPTVDLRKMVRDFYIKIQDVDYYEALGIKESFEPAELQKAITGLKESFDISNFSGIDLGTDHTKLEEINEFIRVAHSTLSDETRRKAYIEKIKSEKEDGVAHMDAEVLARKSEDLLNRGNVTEALKLIERAKTVRPDVAEYQALYAKSLFMSGESEQKFLTAMNHAVDLEPESILVNTTAATIYDGLSRPDDAARFYEKVLELQPDNEKAFISIERIYREKGAWRILERLHRKLIHLCGSRRPQRTIFLAKNLARLYEEHLNDLEKAKAAWDIVLNAIPHDREAKEAVKRIKTSLQISSEPPPQQYESILNQLIASPFNRDLLKSGFQVALTLNPDLAFLFAQTISALHLEESKEEEYFKRYQPPFLPRAWKQIDAEVWSLITDKDDIPEVGKLFETICLSVPEASFFPLQPADAKRFEKSSIPENIGRAIEYTAYQLNVPFPDFYVTSEFKDPVLGTFGDKLVIYVPPTFMETYDSREVVSKITPILSSFWTGRALPKLVGGTKLLVLLKAALELLAPKGIMDAEINRLEGILMKGGQELKLALGGIFTEITSTRGNINVSQWSRGVLQSGYNLSLLLSFDMKTLLQTVPEEFKGPLVLYCLSPEHLKARKMLGISINI